MPAPAPAQEQKPPPSSVSASEVNRAYYSAMAPGMDDYWRKMAAPRFRVRTLLSQLKQYMDERANERRGAHHLAIEVTSLVDLGCGNGQLLAEIAAHFPGMELSGADLAEPQLQQNRQVMPRCRFFAMDLGCADVVPPELAGSFELITASEVIEHVDEPRHLLQNALRLCRPRGRLLLSTQSGPVRETERRVGHRRHFTAEEMRALLRETGWTPLRVWNAGFPFHDLSKWYANRDPDGAMKEFAGQRYGLKQELLCLLLRAAFRFNFQHRGAQLFAVAKPAG